MRKNKARKIVVFLMAVMIAFGSFSMSSKVEAASKPYMKTLNVKWDLKKNKTVTYKTRYTGLGMVKHKAKITNYKVKNSKKKGYKELTFTINFTHQRNVSKNQVEKMLHNSQYQLYGRIGGWDFFAIIDYNSGKCLTNKNKKGVTSEYDILYSSPKYYYDDDGCYVSISNPSVKVKVTYPKTYKGLCLAVGGSTQITKTANDEKFFEGKAVFGKTSYYSKKDKSVAHFMRITK